MMTNYTKLKVFIGEFFLLHHLTFKLTRKEPIRKILSPQAILKPKTSRANSPEETLMAQILVQLARTS